MMDNELGLCAGVLLLLLGGYWTRYQNPRHRSQRRGKIALVGGGGALVLGLTFCLTPQSWDGAVLLIWYGGVLLLGTVNEAVS